MASPDPKRPKLTPTNSAPVGQSPNNSTIESGNASIDDSPISRLPPELLSAIINYLPMPQWSGLELVNRSFRDAVYLSWHSLKEFDVDKDVLTVRQSFNGADLSDLLPSILAKLLLRSPLLSSISGLPSVDRGEDMVQFRSEALHTISQFTHLKQIDFGAFNLESAELVEFMTSSASRDQLKEIAALANYQRTNRYWQDNFADHENRERQAPRLQLEKFSLKTEYRDVFLDPGIIDLIDPSSLTQLILIKIAAPSDYLLSLISKCQQLQQLQFSFMTACRCQEEDGCVHLISSKRLLENISALENLTSLKIGMIENDSDHPGHDEDEDDSDDDQSDAGVDRHYLDILADLPILIDRLGRRGRLVEFGLLDVYYCSNRVITGIGDHLPSLKSLELFTQECGSAVLMIMIQKLVNLEKLTFNCDNSEIEPEDEDMINWNHGITWAVFNAMASHLQHLKILHLWWLNYDVAEFLHLLTRLNQLEELFICGAFFSEVKWEGSFGRLRSLEMRECHEDLVASFLSRAPELRRLVLGGSLRLPDTVLRMIPGACQRLCQLDVADVWDDDTNMKDAVREIIDWSPDLIQLKCDKGT